MGIQTASAIPVPEAILEEHRYYIRPTTFSDLTDGSEGYGASFKASRRSRDGPDAHDPVDYNGKSY
jgi:hypothetical protein